MTAARVPWQPSEPGVHAICGRLALVERIVYEEIVWFLNSSENAQVYVIDTLGTFDAVQLVRLRATRTQLAATTVLRCFDVYGVRDAVQEVNSSLSARDAGLRPLIVVHSFSHAIGQLMASGLPTGHALMVTLLRELRSLVSVFPSLRVTLTSETVPCPPDAPNVMSAFSETLVRPALGTTFPHLVDSLWLVSSLPLTHNAAPVHVAEELANATAPTAAIALFSLDTALRPSLV